MSNVPERYTASMSCQAPSGQCVELVGDFPDWDHPIRMVEVAPGEYQCNIALLPGIYRYKFRLNHRLWFPDPRASIMDESNPFRNAVLVIGGIESPFLFAPDRRHVFLSARGRLVVQVEAPIDMRTPMDAPLELRVNVPGRHWDSTRFLEVARQRGGKILRAELSRPEYAHPEAHVNFHFSALPDVKFELPDISALQKVQISGSVQTSESAGYVPGRRYLNIPVTRPKASHSGGIPEITGQLQPPLLDEPPRWLEHAVFYSIFLDRWLRGGEDAVSFHGIRARSYPSGPSTFYGGDFFGVAKNLDHIAASGANALILSSVRPSQEPLRRYATDMLRVDPVLGGESGLEYLVQSAHERGMRVVAEAALTHVSIRHPLFQRVVRDQEMSEYADWFHIRKFPVSPSDPASYDHLPDQPDCVALDLSATEPRRYAMRSFDELLKTGIDGVLLHGLNLAPADFWRSLRARLRRQNPELLIAGQATGDNVASFAGIEGADAIFDPRNRENVNAFFASETIDAPTFCTRVCYDDVKLGPLPSTFFIQALDTLDTPRFIGAAHMQDRLRLALAWLFLRPGPVCTTYGTELGFEFLNTSLMMQNAWRDRPPVTGLPEHPGVTMGILARLAEIRRNLKPVSVGSYLMEPFGERCLYILRQYGEQQVFALFNAGRSSVQIPESELFANAASLLDVNVMPGTPPMLLPARSARFFSVGL